MRRPHVGSRLAAISVCTLLLARVPVAAQEASLSGRFQLIWEDPAPETGREPAQVFLLIDEAGVWYELELDAGLLGSLGGPAALAGRQVSVDGRPTGAPAARSALPAFRVSSIRDLDLSPSRLANQVREGVADVARWVTILCRFADSVSVVPNPSSYYRMIMGRSYPGMSHFWDELSGGMLEVDGLQVEGWYDLPEPIAGYFTDPEPNQRKEPNFQKLASDCTAAADAAVDFTTIDGIHLQFNISMGASWGGGAFLTLDGRSKVFGMTWMASWAGQFVYGHEMGHAFGMPHSSGPYTATYDSRWDVMSGGNWFDSDVGIMVGTHTIAFHRDLVGWIPPDRKFVPAGGPGSVETVSLDRAALNGGGTGYWMVEFLVLGSEGRQLLTAEARRSAGYDLGVPSEAVVLHRVDLDRGRAAQVVDADGNGDPNDAGAAWTPGEVFDDPGQEFSLAVTGESALGFDLLVAKGKLLRVVVLGEGRVTGDGGVDCVDDCFYGYPMDSPVSLAATAGEGVFFGGWAGSCGGEEECDLVMSAVGEVRALFPAPLETERVFDHLLRVGTPLSEAQALYLDATVGNRNGRLDVGDVRAWLIETGMLSP